MLTLSNLIQEISEKNIKLNIDGDDLKVYASQDVLTQDLIEEIKKIRNFSSNFSESTIQKQIIAKSNLFQDRAIFNYLMVKKDFGLQIKLVKINRS